MEFECNDYNWWWEDSFSFKPLPTVNSRKCTSCGDKIKPKSLVIEFPIFRGPLSDVDERIHGERVYLASRFMCERCGKQYIKLNKAGVYPDITKSLLRG